MFEIRREDTRISFAVTDGGLLINISHHHQGYAITLGTEETEQLISALQPMVPAIKERMDKAEEEAIKRAAAKIRDVRAAEEREANRVAAEAAKREAFKAELRAEILAEMKAEKPEDGGAR